MPHLKKISIAINLGVGRSGDRVLSELMFFFTEISRPTLRIQQPSVQWELWVISCNVRRPVREADHLPPSSIEL